MNELRFDKEGGYAPGHDAALELLKDATDALEEGFILWDQDLKFVFCNEKYKELALPPGHLGPRPGQNAIKFGHEIFKTGFWKLPADSDVYSFADQIGEFIRSYGKNLEIERADDRVVLASSNKTALGGYVLTFMDITDSKRAEAAEATRWDVLNDAIGSLEEGFALWDSDFRLLLCNQKYMDLVAPYRETPFEPGLEGAQVVAETFQAGIYEIPEGVSEQDYIDQWMDWARSHGGHSEARLRDGRTIAVSAKPTELGGVLITAVDVTDVKRAEENRLESLTQVVQATDDCLVLFDKDVNFILANNAWIETFWPHNAPPEQGSDGRKMFRELIEDGFYTIPENHTKDSFFEFGLEAFFSFSKNIPLGMSDGRTLMGSSHKTGLGGYLLSFRDVTELRQAEEELARQKEISYQNEKLSALGELLAGVAHELNNPLSVVFGYAQMLEDKIEDQKTAQRLDLIRQSAERAAKIVKTFLAMARQRPTKIEPCSLNEAITTAIEVSSYGLTTNGTRVVTKLDETVPQVSGDFDQLAQVFTNLIVNAGHALEARGEDGMLTLRSFYNADTDHTVVEVRDNGPGIPKEIQNRIFEPFFTTKDVGQGTGVGLAFSHRIIESHGGILELKSSPGRGTSFFVKLRSAKEIGSTKTKLVQQQAQTKASILVVDDEAGVAQLTHDILVDWGFQVTQSLRPRDALIILENQSFDLVLSDFKMPGMDGQHFYQALNLIAPEYANRIGFITGDAMSANVREFFRIEGCPYIEKPIIKDELLELVQNLLEAVEQKRQECPTKPR